MAEFLKGMPLGVKASDIYISDQSFHKTFRKQYKQVKTADGKRKNIPVEGSITGYNTKYDRLKLTSNYQVCLKDTNFQTRTLSKRDVPSRIYYVDNGKMKKDINLASAKVAVNKTTTTRTSTKRKVI